MSEDQDTRQMSLLEDSHANRSRLQEKEKAEMTTDTSGMKCLELLPKQNRNGLLEKMLQELLTSKTVKSCSRYRKIWKAKASKSNVLLFQLQVSVLGIKEKESGLLPTPTQDSASERTKKYKQGGLPLTMAVKMYPTPRACDLEGGVVKNVELKNGSFSRLNKKGVRFGVKLKDAVHKMYPTPRTGSGSRPNGKGGKVLEEEVMIEAGLRTRGQKLNQMYPTPTHMNDTIYEDKSPNRHKRHSKGLASVVMQQEKTYPTPTHSEHKYRLRGNTQASKCLEALARKGELKNYPTPAARDWKCGTKKIPPCTGKTRGDTLVNSLVREKKNLGGKLNPNFVEFLMGYNTDWTRIEQTELKRSETQSYHKSPLKSEGRLSGRKNNRHEINKKQKV